MGNSMEGLADIEEVPLPTVEDWPLAGRDRQLAYLEQAASRVRGGSTVIVHLEGPAGIGKTALLNTWADGLDRMFVLRATCHPLESSAPFRVMRQLFASLPSSLSGQAMNLINGAIKADTEASIASQKPRTRLGNTSRWPSTLEETFFPLEELALQAAGSLPIAVVVDDLQWIDSQSLLWLSHLAHRVTPPTYLLVTSARTGYTAVAPEPFAELINVSCAQTIELTALGVKEVQSLVTAVYGEREDTGFCLACWEATSGHPLFLRALLEEALQQGVRPLGRNRDRVMALKLDSLHGHIKRLLTHATKPAREVARGLAILEGHQPLALISRYCGTGEAAVCHAATQLRALGLLRAGHDLSLTHTTVGHVALASLSPEDLAAAHSQAAHVLRLSGQSDARIAVHLIASGPAGAPVWAVETLRRAASEALTQANPRRAAELLRAALSHPAPEAKQAALWFELGKAVGHYNPSLAASYMTTVLEGLTDPVPRAEALSLLASFLMLSKTHDTALLPAIAKELTTSAGQGSLPRETLLQVQAVLSWAEIERPLSLKPASLPTGSEDDVEPLTSGERQKAAVQAFERLRSGLPASEVRALLTHPVDSSPPLSPELFPMHSMTARTLLYLDDLESADTIATRLIGQATKYDASSLETHLHAYRAALALRRGHVARASKLIAVAKSAECTAGGALCLTLATLHLDTLIAQGKLEEASRAINLHRFTDQAADTWQWPHYLMSLASLHQAKRDYQAALSLLRETGRHHDQTGTVNPAIAAWRSRTAVLLDRLGDRKEARDLVRTEIDLAKQSGIPRAVGVALRAAARLEEGLAKIRMLSESLSVLQSTPADLENARAQRDYALALLRRDDEPGARQAFKHGLTLIRGHGATFLETCLRNLLHDAGGRLSKHDTKAGLTAAEQHIAQLAMQGMTNPQIAAHLHITQRTVETHLTSTYRKLGIRNRTQLEQELG